MSTLGVYVHRLPHFHGSESLERLVVFPGQDYFWAPPARGAAGRRKMSGSTGESTSSGAGSSRTRDGVPTWNGEANSFVAYEEAALLWEQSLTWEKRYTAGARLVQELTGAAKRLVAGRDAGWVAFRGGVRILMDHLRGALGKPRVNEVTDLLATYFKGCKRKGQESMNDYVTRKFEAYFRASQALKRVAPHYEGESTAPATEALFWSRRSSVDSRSWYQSGPSETDSGGNRGPGTTEASTEEPPSTAPGTEAAQWDDVAWQTWNSRWNSWSTWTWQWHGARSNWEWPSSVSSTSSSHEGPGRQTELLPPFIQGWYLLTDAGLGHGERNLVMTALGGDFSPQRVAQELRNQFPESEVRRRDQGRRFQGFLGDIPEDSDEDLEIRGNTTEELLNEGMTAEGAALVVDAEQEAQDALAALHQARRTLREARQRQHQVKQSRKYYSSNSQGRTPSGSATTLPRDDSQLDCLRCGKRGHRASNCPHKPIAAQTDGGRQSETAEPQQAPFVCYLETREDHQEGDFNGFVQGDKPENVEQAYSGQFSPEPLSTMEAVREGMAVLDGGATQTIGSVAAVEAVLRKNLRDHGDSRLRGISTQGVPTFSFGNSTEDRCLSTARLAVSANGAPGEVSIHTLDKGQSPILLSIDTLRRLGAVIDFQADLVVFRNLDSRRIVSLRRSRTGHQLLPMTQDWLEGARLAPVEIPGLEAYMKDP